MLIASPCCRNNTKSTGFTAKTCGSGRMPCNIKQLLLIFAQTLWRSEPRTFISMAESEPLPRAKFCCIKCFMSSLLLCVHCICMCWSMFMYVGMCTRACIWRPVLSSSITLRLIFLRQTLSQSLELTHWLCLLLSAPSVTSPELWLQEHTTLVLRFWTYISSHAYKEVSSLIYAYLGNLIS